MIRLMPMTHNTVPSVKPDMALADQNSPPMPQAHFTEGHRSNDQCRPGSGISAAADDQRNELNYVNSIVGNKRA